MLQDRTALDDLLVSLEQAQRLGLLVSRGDVFGEETVSSRLVFGVASLPLGSPVALEVILEIKGA
jgi:hypothetical protein